MRTSTSHPTDPRVTPLGRLVTLLVAVIGLVVMHGLIDHGTAHAGEPIVAASAGSSHAAHGGSHDPAPSPTSGDDLPGHDDSGTWLLGLCLALLAVGLTLGLGVLRHRWVERTRPFRSQWTPPVRACDPDPPDLLVLSVQRC